MHPGATIGELEVFEPCRATSTDDGGLELDLDVRRRLAVLSPVHPPTTLTGTPTAGSAEVDLTVNGRSE